VVASVGCLWISSSFDCTKFGDFPCFISCYFLFVAFMINFICLFSVDCVQHIIAGRTEYLFRHRFWSILIYNLHCFFDHIWRVLWLFHLQKHSGCHLECTFDQSYIDVSDFDLDHLQFCGKSWCQYLFLLCFFRVCVLAFSCPCPCPRLLLK